MQPKATIARIDRAECALLGRATAIAQWQAGCSYRDFGVLAMHEGTPSRIILRYCRKDVYKDGPSQLWVPRDPEATEKSVTTAIRAWAKEQRRAAKDAEQLSLLKDQEAAPAEGG